MHSLREIFLEDKDFKTNLVTSEVAKRQKVQSGSA